MDDNYCVYIHTNTVNGKKYVGLTKQKPQNRWRNGKGYKQNIKFWRAIEKYGWEAFTHEIVQDHLFSEQAGQLEQILIQKFDTIENGYNIDLGGSVTNHSEATKEKMRQSMIGKHLTEETKQKIREAKQATKKAVICVETQIKYNGIKEASFYSGVDASSIIRVCKGIQHTAGGYHWCYEGQEPIFEIDKRLKPVLCLTTGKVYESTSAAALDTGSDASNIRKVCNGKYKSTNGLRWKSITPDEFLQFQKEDNNGQN